MSGLTPLTPVYTAGLYPPLTAELTTLLRKLDPDDWLKPTVAGSWRVRDVAAHLLDGDIRRLSGGRDGHPLARRPISSYGDVVDLINDLNAGGITYGERLSARVIVDLLETTGRWVADHFAGLAPHGEAAFPVAWAGETRSEHWMDIGRDYTERWHHQMQIRDAVGAAGLFEPQWLHPLLDLSVRAFPRAYRDVEASVGTAVVFDVRAGDDCAWSIVNDGAHWAVMRGRADHPAATLAVDADTAWRILYNALPPDAARSRVAINGDARLAEPILRTRSVMV